jgi:hypothetical protein
MSFCRSLEHNDIVVVPTFLINDKVIREGIDVVVVSTFLLEDALHLRLRPRVLANSYMGVLVIVLIIVD